MGGGLGVTSYKGSVCKLDGNQHVPELWYDNSKRNLNLNWWDNDWNANYRFLAVRNYFFILTISSEEFFLFVSSNHQASYQPLLVQDLSVYIYLCPKILFPRRALAIT